MSNPLLDQLRADMEKRHRRICRLQRLTYCCVALQVFIAAWSASRIALGESSVLAYVNVLFNATMALVGLHWQTQRRAAWNELRDQFEREIERLEKS